MGFKGSGVKGEGFRDLSACKPAATKFKGCGSEHREIRQ